MTTETQTLPTHDEAKAAMIQEKFSAQENHFKAMERDLVTLREFFVKHHDALAPFVWRCYGWNDCKIVFGASGEEAKAIAKAFGASGWTREHDSYSCGSINWHKDIDGCHLKIEGAESIKPRLIEEVKL